MSGFPSDLFAGSRFAVMGLGRNGLPVARALAGMGAEVTAWDDDAAAREAAGAAAPLSTSSALRERSARTGAPGEGLHGCVERNETLQYGGGPSLAPLREATLDAFAPKPASGRGDGITLRNLAVGGFEFDALILSPGIPHHLPAPHPVAARAQAAGVPILSDADLLFRAVRRAGSRARFVGITGTNGKSTTTALLAHVLAHAGRPVVAGGNLGAAALALPLLGNDGIYVLEMSSYMLERLATLRFDAAAMLNLSADHLDRHGDMASYAAAKRAIFERQTADDLAVIGIDDPLSAALARQMPQAVRISGYQPAEISVVDGWLRAADFRFQMRRAPALPGTHNAQNAAAALALALQFLSRNEWAAIPAALESFPGLPYRQQRIATIDDISFVNDSKATNVDAAARALGCYDRVVWIAGGIAKEGGIAPLAPLFPRIVRAVLIGRDAPALAATLAASGVPHDILGTLEAAVPAAFAAARLAGAPVVLLSPACASFDQFSGFDARGERFAALVSALGRGVAA